MKKIASLVMGLVLSGVISSFAEGTPKVNRFKETLATVPAAELPAKAADLVQHAKSRDRASTTADVVVSAVGINPAAAPAVVGAVSKSVPYMAATAAGTAAAEQPKQAAAIAKAAAAAAPSQARKIVTAVCRAVPNDYRNIALAVSQVVPTANKEILSGIASALPELKPYLDRALAANGGNVGALPNVLDYAAKLTQATPIANSSTIVAARPLATPAAAGSQPATVTTPSPLARGPAIGPPYVPLTSSPTNVTPGGSGEVPVGGRNYAEP